MKLALLRSYAVRLCCKFWEHLCLLGTPRLRSSDPTIVLLQHLTPKQNAASFALKAAPASANTLLKVSVIIPFRDSWPTTLKAIKSLARQERQHLELRLILVDNGSTASETQHGLSELKAQLDQVLPWELLRLDEPFNFSRLNNQGVRCANARGTQDVLLFLNNDIELNDPSSVTRLATFAYSSPHVGAVGCTLTYSSGAIQHLFLAPGIKIAAAHPFKGWYLSPEMAWFREPRPVAAVTGAVMAVRNDVFDSVGGFDEALPTLGQDLDLCLKLSQAGLCNWTLPEIWCTHHEGLTRGRDLDRAQITYLYQKWGTTLTHNPYWSVWFSRYAETPARAMLDLRYPWQWALPS